MHDWQKKFSGLRSQFLERSQERLEALRVLIEHLATRQEDMHLLGDVRQLFHWCAGSGGVYGFEQVTRYGLQGEEICDHLLHDSLPVTPADANKLLALVSLINTCLENEEDAPPVAPVPAADLDSAPKEKKVLLYVESNQVSLHKFTRELQDRGVKIETALTCSAARQSIMNRLPDSLVISLPLADGSGYELASLVRSSPGGERPPIIFLSQQAGFLDKVAAIKSGADGFYEHPIDENEILAKIEHLLERDRPEKYKILSVEDDPDQAEFIKLTLDSAGYNVISLQDPTRFEETFLKCDPDLVLLDIVLGPSMSGFELAQYIRQQDRYAALPIVFLTTENALDMHIRSARIGGDDHLIKPIAPQLLAAAVAGRLEKARTLKKLIDRDGLTSCLNFGPFMDRASALARPDSHRFSLTMMLLDVDSMHIINDRFGYAVGDKVIVALGRLISNSLRNASLSGRIAGDRFAVILENLDDVQVERLSQQLLTDFAKIQQFAPPGPFHSTMSIAFAAYNNNQNVRSWLSEAERLLAEAKDNGGNQVRSVFSSDRSEMRR
jgi:diguanylate cyclase (GGDEF)-like protein